MLARREFLKAGAGFGLSLAVPLRTWAQDAGGGLTLAEAINKAGRQRMLSQRCAKAWLMGALGVLPERAQAWLDGSAALFESQLAELSRLQPNGEIQTLLVQLAADWRGYRAVLIQPPSADAAAELYARNESVLATAHATTQAYERVAGTTVGRLINVSGRQRMLSQRMAKFVYFARYGVESNTAVAGLATAREEFIKALELLKSAPQNTDRIKDELALADQQWFFFQNALAQGNSPKALQDIATTSERMLEQLNLVVGLYEGLAA